MSKEAIRETIATMLTSAFPTAQPGIGMFFENQPFDQPKGHPWVYVEVIDNFTSKAHIGTPSARYMTVGIVSFEIKVPEDTGTKTMRQIGDSISAILMDQNVAIPGDASCHVGYRSCFYRSIPTGDGGVRELKFEESEKMFDPLKVYGDVPNPTIL